MASIPCSTRHSISYMKDLQILLQQETGYPIDSSSSPTTLQYFNMRVTHRLHQYRSLKRQWQEVATSSQNLSLPPVIIKQSVSPNRESETNLENNDAVTHYSLMKKSTQSRCRLVNENLLRTTSKLGKDSRDYDFVELDPLCTKIQQDLVKLRRFITRKKCKAPDLLVHKSTGQRQSNQEIPTTTKISNDDQEKQKIESNIRKTTSLKVVKPLDHVKIAGLPVRRLMASEVDPIESGIINTSNSSSTCSQYAKQQPWPIKIMKGTELSQPLVSDLSQNRSDPIRSTSPTFAGEKSNLLGKSSRASPKLIRRSSSKQEIPWRLSLSNIPPITKRKAASFTKQEVHLPANRIIQETEDTSNRMYTYAASSSSTVPISMFTPKDDSAFPILLHSTCCTGPRIPKRVSQTSLITEINSNKKDDQFEDFDSDENCDYFLEYKQMIQRLPSPIISMDDFQEIDKFQALFDQLDHMRKTMPTTDVYKNFTRIPLEK